MELPQPLQSGAALNTIAPWSRRIIDYLRAITVRPSATVNVATTANGTTLTAAAPARPVRAAAAVPDNNAFMAEARFGKGENGNNIIEVKMLGGTVQGLFGPIEPVPTTFWTTENKMTLFPDPEKEEEEEGEEEGGVEEEEEEKDPYEVNKNEDLAVGEWFWLEYDPEEDEYDPETGEGGRWSVGHGQELPESDPPEEGEGPDGRTVYFAVIPLFRISVFAARNVIQNHFGAVYVPTVSNVVPIQKFPEDSQGAQA